MAVLTPAASPNAGPVPSTLPMSPDRSLAGKLVGELYIAAKILGEGHNVNMEAVRHEIRVLTGSGDSGNGDPNPKDPSSAAGGQAAGGAGAAAPSSPGAPSLSEWKKLVAQLIVITQKLPHAIGCLPDGLKRDMATAIRLGRQICSGTNTAAAEAMKRIEKAAELYRKLGGPSYL